MIRRSVVTVAVTLVVGALCAGVAWAGTSPKQMAKRSLITSTDVPAGFTKVPNSSDDSSDLGKGIAACREYTAAQIKADKATVAKAEVTFEMGNDNVNQSARVLKSTSDVAAFARAWSGRNMAKCLTTVLKKSVTDSVDDPTATVNVQTQLANMSQVGRKVVGYEVLIDVTASDGSSQQAGQSLVFASVGKLGSFLAFQTMTGALVSERDGIIKTALANMKAAAK